jgi:hypothetical protein
MSKTFNFYQKNSSATVSLSADSFKEAEQELFNLVKDDYGWRVDDEDGLRQEAYDNEDDDFDEDHNSSLMFGVDNNQ